MTAALVSLLATVWLSHSKLQRLRVQCEHVDASSTAVWLRQVHDSLSDYGARDELALPPEMAALWRDRTPLQHHPALVCAAIKPGTTQAVSRDASIRHQLPGRKVFACDGT